MSNAAGDGAVLPRILEEHHTGYSVEIAVDLGTSGTGWALVWRPKAGTDDPSSLTINPYAIGEGSSAAVSRSKALTAVLLSAKDDKLVAVGKKARNEFRAALEKGDGSEKEFHYFERFKMSLSPESRNGKRLSESTIKAAGSGEKKPLLLPFVKLLEAVKEEAIERINNTAKDVKSTDIGWVVTVPAIWDEEAKGFMRRAAFKAGLIEREDAARLLLVLEPEAAAVAAILDAPEPVRKQFTPGHKLIIVDAGGGTVDITVSEVAATNPIELRELLPASGGPWGGTATDALLVDFVVKELLSSVSAHVNQASTAEILDAWETAKCNYKVNNPSSSSSAFSPSSSSSSSGSTTFPTDSPGGAAAGGCAGFSSSGYQLRLGTALDFLPEKDSEGNDIDGFAALKSGIDTFNAKRDASKHGPISVSRQKMVEIPASIVHERIMDPVIDKTVKHVRTLLQDPKAKDANTILLVGGFAESSYLQKRMRDAFNGGTASVLVAIQPGLAVLYGAAYFGCYPRGFIRERVLRSNFGFVFLVGFDSSKHHQLTRKNVSSRDYSENILNLVAKRGTSVKPNDAAQPVTVVPVSETDPSVPFPLWRTDKVIPTDYNSDPHYLLKPGWAEAGIKGIPESCKCGEVNVICFDPNDPKQASNRREDRTMQVEFLFGQSEILVKVTAKISGRTEYTRLKYD